jgi:hypothetical protein
MTNEFPIQGKIGPARRLKTTAVREKQIVEACRDALFQQNHVHAQ